MSEMLDALREFLSHHLTLRGLEEVEGYLEHFVQLEAENEALRQDLREWLSLACRQYREMPHNAPLCPMRKGIEKTAKLLNVKVDALLTGEDDEQRT